MPQLAIKEKEKTEIRNRQPEDHVASLLREYVWGWNKSFFLGRSYTDPMFLNDTVDS